MNRKVDRAFLDSVRNFYAADLLRKDKFAQTSTLFVARNKEPGYRVWISLFYRPN